MPDLKNDIRSHSQNIVCQEESPESLGSSLQQSTRSLFLAQTRYFGFIFWPQHIL